MSGFKMDVPIDLSEKTMSKLDIGKNILHLIIFATGVLTICVVAPLIAIEAKYLGSGNPGPNYTLFVAIVSAPVPILTAYFPWMYQQHNKFKRLGKFCMKPRTNIIFNSFNTVLWATAAIASTVQANNPSNCAFNEDLIKNDGDSYTSSWGTQCNLAKVSAAFSWITCILWLVALLLTLVSFWREKSIIQQRMNEQRTNKQNALEERRQQEEYKANSRSEVYDDEAGIDPFGDNHRYSPPSEGGMHNAYDDRRYTPSPQPYFDPNVPAGQYVSPSPGPVSYSPMPDPAHYNHNNNF